MEDFSQSVQAFGSKGSRYWGPNEGMATTAAMDYVHYNLNFAECRYQVSSNTHRYLCEVCIY